MSHLPRLIPFEKIIGYVYCKDIGVLPCENISDKTRLMVLGDFFMTGVKENFIIIPEGEFPQFKDVLIPQKYKECLQVLLAHLLKNNDVLLSHFPRKVLNFIITQLGERIIYLSNNDLHKMLKGKIFRK